jgi:uncharacterized protein YcbX
VTGAVAELWRFPVKSFRGEQLDEVELEERGIPGDRLWAVTDGEGKLGSGKTTNRFRLLKGLFDLSAKGVPPTVTLPDGRELPLGPEVDAFLHERYGDDTLTVARETTVMHHDTAPLHVMTTASLRWLADRLPASQVDRRRFRPNVLVDVAGSELVEDAWPGARFALGGAEIEVVKRCERCVMTTNRQEELEHDPAILRTLTEENEINLGVLARVVRPGAVRVGDALRPL